MPEDKHYMAIAYSLAQQAASEGEVPVGAVVVVAGEVVGRGYNRPIVAHDPSAHAEIVALRDAAATLNNYRIPDATLYVTMEPCTMCAGAMVHARIQRLVYGCPEPKSGVAHSNGNIFASEHFNHRIEVSGGVMASECSD